MQVFLKPPDKQNTFISTYGLKGSFIVKFYITIHIVCFTCNKDAVLFQIRSYSPGSLGIEEEHQEYGFLVSSLQVEDVLGGNRDGDSVVEVASLWHLRINDL